MQDSPFETRIKLQTSFQDSYLEERQGRVDPRMVGVLQKEIREVEMEVELEKATHQFLMKQFNNSKNKKIKDQLVPTASQFLEKVMSYQDSLRRLQQADLQNTH